MCYILHQKCPKLAQMLFQQAEQKTPLKQIVRLRSGSSLQCDIVVVGAGAIPNVDFCPPELGKPRVHPGWLDALDEDVG